MAVYTHVDNGAIGRHLADYPIGTLVSARGIAQGVDNSNYAIETTGGRFVLTIFEDRINPAELPYFAALLHYLAERGISCPRPVRASDGATLRPIAGKPAMVQPWLDGVGADRPTIGQCRDAGALLARLHMAGRGFDRTRTNDLGAMTWTRLWQRGRLNADRLRPGLADDVDVMLARTVADWPETMPTGTIHGDLFPDNVFFNGDRLSGVIDFYFACTDLLAYDLAIALTAWSFDDRNRMRPDRAGALLSGYASVRSLSGAERSALPLLLRGACLRFFLTRLVDWASHPADAIGQPKDPLEYVDRLHQFDGAGNTLLTAHESIAG